MKSKGHLYIHIHHSGIQQSYLMQVYKLMQVYCSMQKQILQRDLSGRTTITIWLIEYREVILGYKILSGIIYTINQCISLLIIEWKILSKLLCIKIRCVTLQQCHNMVHHRRREVSLRQRLLSRLQQLFLGFLLVTKNLQFDLCFTLPYHQLIQGCWFRRQLLPGGSDESLGRL
jgi:hypothetical protein